MLRPDLLIADGALASPSRRLQEEGGGAMVGPSLATASRKTEPFNDERSDECDEASDRSSANEASPAASSESHEEGPELEELVDVVEEEEEEQLSRLRARNASSSVMSSPR